MFTVVVHILDKPMHTLNLVERVKLVNDAHKRHPHKIKASTKVINYCNAIRRSECWQQNTYQFAVEE